MIKLGEVNRLIVEQKTDNGYVLVDDKQTPVLLPNNDASNQLELNSLCDVFVYKDNAGNFVATLQMPKIKLGEFAWLEARDVNDTGAFMDWGMPKELLVPYRHQNQNLIAGRFYMIYLLIDLMTDRLIGTTKINNFLDNSNLTVEVGDEVNLLVIDKSDLGYNVIINHKHKGLIYANEVFTALKAGDAIKGFIKLIRAENKIDVMLQRHGYEATEPIQELILAKLKNANGFLDFTDKSEPALIYKKFGVSKKVFKKAIGALYKDKCILIEEEGIRLI